MVLSILYSKSLVSTQTSSTTVTAAPERAFPPTVWTGARKGAATASACWSGHPQYSPVSTKTKVNLLEWVFFFYENKGKSFDKNKGKSFGAGAPNIRLLQQKQW